jgi:LacI family transcriptional regulator
MPSRPRPTLKSIADRLGVSTSTVSRALNGKGKSHRISEPTQRAVQEMALKLGFAPSLLARSLRLKKTATVGLVIPDVSNPFFAWIAHEVAVSARDHGYSIALCDSQEQTAIEVESLEALARWQVEGLLVCPVGRANEHFRAWERSGTPLVAIDRIPHGCQPPAVVSDNSGGARDATRHLLDNGHRRIACIQGTPVTSSNEERVSGYREALVERGVEFDERLVVGDSFLEDSGYRAMRNLLRFRRRPTAVFAFGNLLALGVIRSLDEAGFVIPDDISVIGFDDHPYADHLATPLTTVAQDCRALGQQAFELLRETLSSGHPVDRVCRRVPTTLIQRRSVRTLT